MWLIKLPLKLLALPVLAIVGALSLLYELFINLSALVLGIGYLIIGGSIVILLMHGLWAATGLVVAFAAVVFLAFVLAEALMVCLDELRDKLMGFVFS